MYDQSFIHAAYQNSKIDNIITDAAYHQLPAYSFGPELPQGWCYYYQKADLARQEGDWDEIARLGNDAQKLDLHPNDQIEWMPFLQAYAVITSYSIHYTKLYECCQRVVGSWWVPFIFCYCESWRSKQLACERAIAKRICQLVNECFVDIVSEGVP